MVHDSEEIISHSRLISAPELSRLFSTDTFKVGNKVNRNILLSCDHGLMIVNRFDCNSNRVGQGQMLLDHGNVSTVESVYCHDSIKHIENPVIFDIGANIGTFTTWMAKAFPLGKIYSFEPQRSVFQMLCGNMAINNIYNVHAYNFGIGSTYCILRTKEPNYFKNVDYGTYTLNTNASLERVDQDLNIEVRPLDLVVDQYGVTRVDLIKIDVEGMDMDVIYGGIETIKKFRPKIFIEHIRNGTSIKDEIIQVLTPYQYDFRLIDNNILCS